MGELGHFLTEYINDKVKNILPILSDLHNTENHHNSLQIGEHGG